MKGRSVNLLVFVREWMDEAQAGFQGVGETPVARLARGMSKSEVTRQLGVTRQTVAAWERRFMEGGREALKRCDLGRPRQLDAKQERELGKLIMAGALAAGFPTELWILPRIGKVIVERFGVEYNQGHLWHLLQRMGFWCKKPEKRAIQRDEGFPYFSC